MASAIDVARGSAAEQRDRLPEVERRIGTTVAFTYRIVRHIGSGSSSHVFAAEHTRLGKPVAIKILRSEAASSQRAALRFRREAASVARLQHEHIVSVVDCGELDDGAPFLVMELLEGEDLRSLLRREGALPARRAVQIVIEACRALSAVHSAGLIHRDLKPENLFITRRSTGEDWCKVLDFGVAKQLAGAATAQDAIIGTLRYMAPEQLSDGRSVDQTTDVYALGAILYECLTGRAPHDGANEHELMYQIMNQEPAPLLASCPHLPPALTQIVQRSIEKSRARRPQSAEELGHSLQNALQPRGGGDGRTLLDDDRALVALPRKTRTSRRAALFSLAIVGVLGTAALAWNRVMRPVAVSSPQPIRVAQRLASSTTSPKTVVSVRGQHSIAPLPTAMPAEVPRSSVTRNTTRPPVSPSNLGDNRKPASVRVGGFDPANPYDD